MPILDVADELKGLDLGNTLRNRRATLIAARIQAQPDASFPDMFDEAELEGHYRFTNSPHVAPSALLAPHRAASWKRAADDEFRLVVHDTSELAFPGERPRAGLVHSGKKSVLQGHFSLLVGIAEGPVVHGLVGDAYFAVANQTWERRGLTIDDADSHGGQALGTGSERWIEAVKFAHDSATPGAPLVHVMDREADDYPLLWMIQETGDQFVVRSSQNRRTEEVPGNLAGVMNLRPFVVERHVPLSRRGARRPPDELKRHPPRDSRIAKLSIRYGSVTVLRPGPVHPGIAPDLQLNVVDVVELAPPEGETPVRWRLLTTLPVATAADAERVVDIYRKRWLIEEFFKALKTGCALEERQAESVEALLNTLALLLPVAVRLLQIRAAGRTAPDAPADGLLDAFELEALRVLAPKAKMGRRPTNREIMAAIAVVGGHLKSNGQPGWQVLGRGLQHLLIFAAGLRAAREHDGDHGDDAGAGTRRGERGGGKR